MPDQFTTVTTTGYGSRILNSIKGIFIGLLLVVGAFILLYWNEGRVDPASIAKNAVEVSAQDATAGASADGKLVSVSGTLASDQPLGDDPYLKAGPYVALQRHAEMFAWVEHKDTKTTSNAGGSQTTQTTYSYTTEWTSSPQASTSFAHPEGHQNPPSRFQDANSTVTAAKVGAYSIEPGAMTIHSYQTLQLTPDNALLTSGMTLGDSTHEFIGNGTFAAPQVGDMRLSYSDLPTGGTVTVLGQRHSDAVAAYFDQKKNTKMYDLLAVGSKAEAVAALHGEFATTAWMFRGLGFFLMWIGLMLLLGPITTVLDVLPFLGSLGRGLIGLVSFVIALVLTGVIILVSMVLHNLIAVLLAVAAAFVVLYFMLGARKKKPTATMPPAAMQ